MLPRLVGKQSTKLNSTLVLFDDVLANTVASEYIFKESSYANRPVGVDLESVKFT